NRQTILRPVERAAAHASGTPPNRCRDSTPSGCTASRSRPRVPLHSPEQPKPTKGEPMQNRQFGLTTTGGKSIQVEAPTMHEAIVQAEAQGHRVQGGAALDG